MFGWLKRRRASGPIVSLPEHSVSVVKARKVKEIVDWGLMSLGIPDIWSQTQGEGIKVAVLDTGIARNR